LQCHWFKVAVEHVRAGAPDPSKPVLVLDRGPLQVASALDKAFPPAGSVPRVIVEPRSPGFVSTPLTTTRFSAIIVASDMTCGGCGLNERDSTPDSDAINARKDDVEAFFNAGGGILALAGGHHGDGDPATGADTYYSFVPLPVGGVAVAAPFTLTPAGQGLGFEDSRATPPIGTNDDVNCCPTHNSFMLPVAGGRLTVAETDNRGFAETLFAAGLIGDGGIVAPVRSADVIKLPTGCASRRRFRIRLRNPRGFRIERATVSVNGKLVRVVKGRRLRAAVDLRGLPKGRFEVAIRVVTTHGLVITGKRTYRTCASKRPSPPRPPRL